MSVSIARPQVAQMVAGSSAIRISVAEWPSLKNKILNAKKREVIKAVLITPWLADQLVAFNTGNRPVREIHLLKYTRTMELGAFQYNPNNPQIIFDWTGKLGDGQHRLLACKRSNTAFISDIVVGEDPAVLETIDLPATRSLGDSLHFAYEVKAANNAVAIARMLIAYERGSMNKYNQSAVIDVEAKARVLGDPFLQQVALKHLSGGLMPPRTAAVVYYLFFKNSPEACVEFFKQYTTGLGILNAGSPVATLRKQLQAQKGRPAKLPFQHAFVWMIKAAIAFRDGRSVYCLKYDPEREGIPTFD